MSMFKKIVSGKDKPECLSGLGFHITWPLLTHIRTICEIVKGDLRGEFYLTLK